MPYQQNYSLERNRTGPGAPNNRGYGNLISNVRSSSYSTHQTSQRRNLRSPSHRNDTNSYSTFHPQANVEFYTFKTKIGQEEGPTVKIQKQEPSTINQIDMVNWFDQFNSIVKANGWSHDHSLQALRLICDSVYHDSIAKCSDIISALIQLRTYIFPSSRFIEFESQLKFLNVRQFQSVTLYAKEFRRILNMANYCLPDDQQLTNREIFTLFCKGLHHNQKLTVVKEGKFDIEEIAVLLDTQRSLSELIELPQERYNTQINHYPTNRQRNGYQRTPQNRRTHRFSNYKERCKVHPSSNHTNSECYKQGFRKETKEMGTNNSKGHLIRELDAPTPLEFRGKINNKLVVINFDSGTVRSYISKDLVKPNEIREILPPYMIRVADGRQVKIKHKVVKDISFNSLPHKQYTIEAYILPNIPVDVIIGLDFMKKHKIKIDSENEVIHINDSEIEFKESVHHNHESEFGIASRNNVECSFPDNELEEKVLFIDDTNCEQLIENFKQLNRNTGVAKNVSVKIKLTDDIPIKSKPFRLAYNLVKPCQHEISRLLHEGIIRKSTSPYSCPAFPIRKKSGEIRLIVDFRQLNRKIIIDNFPFPTAEDLLINLKNSSWFSKIDLKNGYNQGLVAPEDCHKTSFVLPFGQFEYMRLPFGLASAPRKFQRYISSLFANDS